MAEMMLPYGTAITSDGTEVLFNRSYRLLYRRSPESYKGEPANSGDLTPRYRILGYFYEPPNDPFNNSKVYLDCVVELVKWGASGPTEAMIPAAWDLYRDAFAPS